MTTLREAAQQALEALEGGGDSWRMIGPAIDALRAALEQPEQEPVAWMYVGLTFNNDMHGPHLVWRPEHMDAMSAEKGVVASPLYTHPPRREWRGLTEDEVAQMWSPHPGGSVRRPILGWAKVRDFSHAIEAALKERNV